MPILKHYRKSGYVQISNALAQDSKLSYEALGLLVNLLSRPEDWVIKKTALQNKRCGEVMLNRIFKELQENGYLRLIDEREFGKITNRIWFVSDEPMPSSENLAKTPGNLNAGKPQFEETSSRGNQELQIHTNTNTEEEKTHTECVCSNSNQKKAGLDQEFEKCWAEYPKRKGSASKAAARERFIARISNDKALPATLLLATVNYRRYCDTERLTGTPFVMMAEKFYGVHRYYEGYIEEQHEPTLEERVLANRKREAEEAKKRENEQWKQN
jgi:hypothetical protein